MQKGNLNMLSDQPDDALNKQCNKELGEMVTQILDSLGGIMKQMTDALTPEQKQKIREMMKNQDSPTLIMNLIEKLKPNSK
jgi:Spy/CpxP family protein refolding chaperone